jgi:hypothetical protein
MKSHFKNLHHAFNIIDKVGFRYESPKPKISDHNEEEVVFTTKILPQSTKILTKYMKRVGEVEKIEKLKNDHLAKFHDNLLVMRLSS